MQVTSVIANVNPGNPDTMSSALPVLDTADAPSVVDLDTYSVGFGGHYGIAENLDVVGRIGWTKVEISSPALDADDDGYLVDLALRGRVGDAVELEGGARYTDFSDGGDATGLFVGGRFHFNETWALGAEYQDGDDSSSILAYVRASF